MVDCSGTGNRLPIYARPCCFYDVSDSGHIIEETIEQLFLIEEVVASWRSDQLGISFQLPPGGEMYRYNIECLFSQYKHEFKYNICPELGYKKNSSYFTTPPPPFKANNLSKNSSVFTL